MIAPGESIAVVGAGVAGITAAHLLQERYTVTLLERADRLGGHTNTITIPDGPDQGARVDTGFIVLNDTNYPLFHRLLERLECRWRWSDMSFSYESATGDWSYAGTGFNGLFAQRRNLFRPAYYRFLKEIIRFCRASLSDLEQGSLGNRTMQEYLDALGCSERVRRRYIYPMAAAIWSAPQQDVAGFPAATLLHFWRNHGLLSTQNRPRWQTVCGGSSTYVEAFRKQFTGTLRTGVQLKVIERDPQGVTLRYADGQTERYAAVVIATHADQTLPLLATPTADEVALLGAWNYQDNKTVLHTDIRILPRNRRAWASWNYVEPPEMKSDQPVPVTYHMNQLQGLKTTKTYCVTLNPVTPVAPEHLIETIHYAHPVYSREAVATQPRLPELNGNQRTWYCGSYFGYGFHEDAVRSGVRVAECLGISKV